MAAEYVEALKGGTKWERNPADLARRMPRGKQVTDAIRGPAAGKKA